VLADVVQGVYEGLEPISVAGVGMLDGCTKSSKLDKPPHFQPTKMIYVSIIPDRTVACKYATCSNCQAPDSAYFSLFKSKHEVLKLTIFSLLFSF